MTARSYFVTGTDTGVGKTRVAAALIHLLATRGLRAAGMKPVASGAFLQEGLWCNEDVQALQAASNVLLPDSLVNPYLLRQATAPHIAAAEEGVQIGLEHLVRCHAQLQRACDVLIVEGAGGFMVPLDANFTSSDLVIRLRLPVVLVVGIRLGCINHALLSALAIRSCGLHLAGWVANHIDASEDRAAAMVDSLVQRLQAPLLGRLPWSPAMTAAQAAACLTWPDPA